MKIIASNIIENVSAGSSHANFPPENVLDLHSRKVWMPTINLTTFQAIVGGGADAVLIYGISAQEITITVTDAWAQVVKTETFPLVVDDGYGPYVIDAAWMDYPLQGSVHTIALSINGGISVPMIGIVFAGKSREFRNPVWGFSDESEDNSIIYDLDNGFEYIFPRNVRRVFQGRLETPDKTEYYNFLRLTRAQGPNPVACLMGEDLTPVHEWLTYARIVSPKGTQAKYSNNTISFTLKEFL